MRLLLDASMSPAVAEALRVVGHDVVDHREVLPAAAPDTTVLALASAQDRVVVARDFDMAELVLRGFARAPGVIIVAFDFVDATTEATRINAELSALGEQARGAVHILEPAGIRSRPYDIGA